MLPTALLAADGTPITARALTANDGDKLAAYFAGLSTETRRRFGPHPLDAITAHQLCQEADAQRVIRLVAEDHAKQHLLAYFILELTIGPHEQQRYTERGIHLEAERDCTFAPSVADDWQNRGLGSPLLRHLCEHARQLGRRYMLLMGGTQCSNARARHFYAKHGFVTVGHYEFPAGVANQDMYLALSNQGVLA